MITDNGANDKATAFTRTVTATFSALKHWRGLATRYDKLALTYRGDAVLAAILSWLRSPSTDTP